MRVWGIVFCFMLALGWTTRAEAVILINEILADPAAGAAGDANNDGTGSSTQDEFVELLNAGDGAVDIAGWYLSDAIKARHIFAGGSVLAGYGFLVVFGGGSPDLPAIAWQLASTGGLSLNNTGETVTLYDPEGLIIDQAVYGAEGGQDQSLVRWPEGQGTTFALHSSLTAAEGRLFSPGTLVNGQAEFPSASAVPEIPSLWYIGLGLAFIIVNLISKSNYIKPKPISP